MPRYTARQKTRIKERVIQCLSAGDISMKEICEEENMPPRSTIYRWRSKDPEFDTACDRAEKGGYDNLAADILSKFEDLDFKKLSTRCANLIVSQIKKTIGQELTQEQLQTIKDIVDENALDAKFANAEVQRVTNQFRAVMMFLSKRNPAKYGERLDINQTVDDKRDKSPQELEQHLSQLLEQRKKLTNNPLKH